MFRQILLSFVCSALTCTVSAATAEAQLKEIRARFNGPSIRIQLMQDTDGALVEVKGRYNVYDPKTGKQLDTAFASSSYYMYPTTDGLKWGGEFPGVYQLLIVPDKLDTTVLVAGTEYHGIAYLYQMQHVLGAVNETSLEDFVDSLLSTHLPTTVTHKEAIAAAAIALRTQAFRMMEQSENPYWDIRARDVGYRGSSVERTEAAFVEALRNTKGLIVQSGSLPVDVKWFTGSDASLPAEEIQRLADEGKDARAILEKLFPNCFISKISQLH